MQTTLTIMLCCVRGGDRGEGSERLGLNNLWFKYSMMLCCVPYHFTPYLFWKWTIAEILIPAPKRRKATCARILTSRTHGWSRLLTDFLTIRHTLCFHNRLINSVIVKGDPKVLRLLLKSKFRGLLCCCDSVKRGVLGTCTLLFLVAVLKILYVTHRDILHGI